MRRYKRIAMNTKNADEAESLACRAVFSGRLMNGQWTVAAARADAVFAFTRTLELHGDGPPPAIGIRLRIIVESIEMRQVVANCSERFFLLGPILGEIDFASGGRANAVENLVGKRILLRLMRADHVNRNTFGLCKLFHVLWRRKAGIVRTI